MRDPDTVGSLSVVLPAYNERTVIAEVVEGVIRYLNKHWEADFEIVAVNDGSTDGTADVLHSLAGEFPQVRVVDHARNMGYGQALRRGFNAAGQDWILLMDADGQFAIRDIDKLLQRIGEAGMAIGHRARRADAWWRALFTWGYVRVVRALFGLPFRDVGCGFKLFRRSDWQRIQPVVSRDHKIFSVEWLWKMRLSGVAIAEVPVQHFPRTSGRATGARPYVVWLMLRELVRLRLRLDRSRV